MTLVSASGECYVCSLTLSLRGRSCGRSHQVIRTGGRGMPDTPPGIAGIRPLDHSLACHYWLPRRLVVGIVSKAWDWKTH